MPELPDIAAYLVALEPRIVRRTLQKLRIGSPFLLRTFEPSPSELEGRRVNGISSIGKRIVFEIEDELFAVIHLMIAGRFRWKDETGAAVPKKLGLAAFDFDDGTLLLTEAGSKRRASLSLFRGREALAEIDPGGADVFGIDRDAFARILRRGNHTLKRALTEPRNFSGIGNAYSDEILHAARLSPLQLTSRLGDDEIDRLFEATRVTLADWRNRLTSEARKGFPEKVTAFRPEMAVHGKYGQPCPACGSPVQRIVYADNETNYCATCQTEGKVLADRAMSRLLKKDWPRSIDEL
ncbi:MAG: formamidopyrimidine-DNA glycosylase [Acidobacteria bacterium]|nr:formamidopyrimidine-DNA glycosylase [Acidobacteriota bacterium]